MKIDLEVDDQSISSIESAESINADLSDDLGRGADIFSLRKSKEKHANSNLEWYFKDLAN